MRVASLDLIRGVAVLGILAINIAGFAGPSVGTLSPNWPAPSSAGDQAAFAFNFVVFEGKMRALFAILFGASMALFIDRADAQGRDGDRLQAMRLGWLLLFGVLHYVLLWWGDILFAYAVCGIVLLLLHRLPERLLGTAAAALFVLLHVQGMVLTIPMVAAEEMVRLGQASAEQAAAVTRYHDYLLTSARQELDQYGGGFGHILMIKLRTHPFWLLEGVRDGFGEFLPLMTLGLILQRRGFFAGVRRWSLALTLGIGAILAGLAVTAAALAWLWPRGFPPIAMDAALRYSLALPHLAMALGYAVLLVLAAPWLARTVLGQRIVAAGQMAFSNYLGTSLVMTVIFYGWGLAWFGQFGPLRQWAFVLLGWALMLGWSAPWLHRWRRGPLEWLWRSLTMRRLLPNRR
jgi:uncharacterized protein